MERYIDGLDVPPRYEEIVEGHRDKVLGDLTGVFCGYPVFSKSQEIINPTTGEVVGYSSDIQVGCQTKVWMVPFENMLGTVYSKEHMTIDELLTHGETLLEKERRRSAPLDMGWTGIKAAAFSGVVGGLLEWFDFSSIASVTGATAAAAIGGLSSVYRRHRDKERFRRHINVLSGIFLSMEKTTFSVNLLASDSYIDEDIQTGSPDNRQSSNTYLIGGVPVDQQQRFNSFWDQADKILGEYGFTEWQGYRTVGLPALIRRILEDVHDNSDFKDDYKREIGFEVGCFGQSRSLAIKGMEEIQKKLLRIKHGLEKNDLTDPDKLVISQIEQVDQKYAEEFRNFIARIRKIDIKAKKESIQDLLVSIYGGKSSLQGYFWGELSRVLAENSIDPSDEVVTEPVQFIVDIPKIIQAGNENYPSKDTARQLYEAFYKSYSEKYPGMLPPDEFMTNFSISEYGIYSIVPLPW